MKFNRHSALEGSHAFLSASKSSWVNYTPEKLKAAYEAHRAAQRGTELHALAAQLIKHRIKQARTKQTFQNYVNDAIGFRMDPEVILYYSPWAYGTADAICFRNQKLRIHDLKTGVHPANVRQLEVYAALFCLEYDYKPGKINMELRIYQNDEIMVHVPEPSDIAHIMGWMKQASSMIDDWVVRDD